MSSTAKMAVEVITLSKTRIVSGSVSELSLSTVSHASNTSSVVWLTTGDSAVGTEVDSGLLTGFFLLMYC